MFLTWTDLARLRARLPAVGGDEVAVVLHGLGPVVHEVLIDVVGIEQRRGLERGEQILGDGFDQRLGMAVLGEALEARGVGLPPLREELGRGIVEGGELGVAEDGGLHLGDRESQLAVAGAVGLRTARRARWAGPSSRVSPSGRRCRAPGCRRAGGRRCPASPPARCCRCSAAG